MNGEKPPASPAADLGSGFLGRAREAVCYEDRTWATPFHMDVGLLYYRADLVGPDEVTARAGEEGWRGLLELADEERAEHGLEYGYAGQFADYEGLTVNTLELVLGGNSLAVTEESAHREQAGSLVGYLTSAGVQERIRDSGLLPARGVGYELTDAADTEIEYWRGAAPRGRRGAPAPAHALLPPRERGPARPRARATARGASDPHPEDMVCDLEAALAGAAVSTCD